MDTDGRRSRLCGNFSFLIAGLFILSVIIRAIRG
jgi:hypothetical protein